GEVAPKVTIAPRSATAADLPWGMAFPSFAGFDRMIEQMQCQSQEMIRRAQEMQRRPGVAAPYIASFGDMPAGESSSTTVVSVSNGGATCTRTTQMVSQGAGKSPKVTSNVSGQCGDSRQTPSGPVNRTLSRPRRMSPLLAASAEPFGVASTGDGCYCRSRCGLELRTNPDHRRASASAETRQG